MKFASAIEKVWYHLKSDLGINSTVKLSEINKLDTLTIKKIENLWQKRKKKQV